MSSAPVRVAYADNFGADGASIVKEVYGQSVLLTRTAPTAFVAHLLPAGAAAADAADAAALAAALPASARPLPVHRDVDGAVWVTLPVPGSAAAPSSAAAAALALAQAGPMPTPLAPLGGCDRKFVPPSPQKQPDFAEAAAGLAPDADARRALLGVPGGGGGGGGGSQSQPHSQSQPMSPDGGVGAGAGGRPNAAAAGSLHRLPPSARASPVAIKPSPFKERVDAATAAVVRKQRSLFQQPAAAGGGVTAEAAAAAKAMPPPPPVSRDRGIGGIPGSQEVPDV